MSFLRLALGVALSLASGYLLAELLLLRARTGRWLKFWLGLGLGMGYTSINYIIWQLAGLAPGALFFGAEILAVSALYLAWRALRRRSEPAERIGDAEIPMTLSKNWRGFLNGSLLLAGALAGLTYLSGSLLFPHGSWDAWAIWNLSARFLFLGSAQWQAFFHPALFHPDYPLLLGSSVARLWAYRGVLDFIAPSLIALAFYVATFGLVYAQGRFMRGELAARLAGLALLGSSSVLVIAPAQIADLPLGFYLLSALACLALYQRAAVPGFILTAGLSLGLGIWTKNEGWLLAIAVPLAWLSTQMYFDRKPGSLGRRLREMGWLLIGLIPGAACALIQKLFLAPPNDLIAGQGIETLARLADAARWLQIGQEFGLMSVSLQAKYSAPLAILAILALIFGLRRDAFRQPPVWTNMGTLALTLGGYFLAYLTSPHDLNWHLSTSLFRLYAQLWPAAVFTLILVIHLPGEASQAPVSG